MVNVNSTQNGDIILIQLLPVMNDAQMHRINEDTHTKIRAENRRLLPDVGPLVLCNMKNGRFAICSLKPCFKCLPFIFNFGLLSTDHSKLFSNELLYYTMHCNHTPCTDAD